jgi:hypothetical protein
MNKIVLVLFLLVMSNVGAMDAPENLKAKQLWEAIYQGDRVKFDQLLSEGVSPLVPYMWDHSDGYVACRLPVVCAIKCHQYDVAAKLLETSPEKQIGGTKEGYQQQAKVSLMDFAAMYGSYECIPLLLSRGGIINERIFQIAWRTDDCCEERRQKFLEEIRRIHVMKIAPGQSSK